MNTDATEVTWVFKKEFGAWWYEAEFNGHVLTVGHSIDHMWTAAVDGVRVGRRSTVDNARRLAIETVLA